MSSIFQAFPYASMQARQIAHVLNLYTYMCTKQAGNAVGHSPQAKPTEYGLGRTLTYSESPNSHNKRRSILKACWVNTPYICWGWTMLYLHVLSSQLSQLLCKTLLRGTLHKYQRSYAQTKSHSWYSLIHVLLKLCTAHRGMGSSMYSVTRIHLYGRNSCTPKHMIITQKFFTLK